jgi:hypothetical protein
MRIWLSALVHLVVIQRSEHPNVVARLGPVRTELAAFGRSNFCCE